MSEATVGDGTPIVNEELFRLLIQTVNSMSVVLDRMSAVLEQAGGMPGVPDNMFARAAEVKKRAQVGNDTWAAWKEAGLPIVSLGGEERILTRKLFEWIEAEPEVADPKRRNKKKGK